MSPAERQRRHRALRRAGIKVYRVKLRDAEIEQFLADEDWLPKCGTDSHDEVEAALAALLTHLSRVTP